MLMIIPDNERMGRPVKVIVEPDTVKYRGEEYECMFVSFLDENGESFTTTGSDTIWYNQVTNQYRERHGIPYQDEIVALRERYGLSAAKMSQILGFGANQYRLYEDGEVPSESNGKMIRGAMNPMVFRDLVCSSSHLLSEREVPKICKHLDELIAGKEAWQTERWEMNRLFYTGRGIKNGFAPQSMERLKNLLLYVLGKMGDVFQTKMNKVLFYIDFLSYRQRGMALSGLAYNAIEFGPVPQRWDRVYSAFDEVIPVPRMVYEQESLALTAETEADMGCFSKDEIAIIDTVCEKMKGLSAHDISALSHKEPAWQRNLNQVGTIPYSDAFSLVAFGPIAF